MSQTNNSDIQPDNQSESPTAPFTIDQTEQLKSILTRFANINSRINKQNFEDITKRKNTSILRYNTEDISKWLQNPQAFERQLRQVSNYFYNNSAIYGILIQYMAYMPTFAYNLIPVSTPNKLNVKNYQKAYLTTAQFTDKIIQKNELYKVMLNVFKEDVFYGYEHETEDSFFIQQLNADYCKISSEEDGCYNFAFDFSYFRSNPDHLELFPEEFKIKYEQFIRTPGQGNQWIELDSDKTICIKLNHEVYYPLIPFSTIFPSIIELEEYKKIKKQASLNDNFMALIQKIPMDEKNPDINKFLIDLELAMQFHQMADEALHDGISLITSPMDITPVKIQKGNTDSNNVKDAYSNAFTDAGVSQFIFNSDKNTSIGLGKSITADEQIVFGVLSQIERWINRKLKRRTGTYKFKVSMLNITHFNESEKQKEYLTAAQNGVPTKMAYSASVGLTPLDTINMAELENTVLGLHEKFIPLQTSYTQSADDQNNSGRPSKSENEISDSGQQSRDRDSDNRKQEG